MLARVAVEAAIATRLLLPGIARAPGSAQAACMDSQDKLRFEPVEALFDGQALPGQARLFRARVAGGWLFAAKTTTSHELAGLCFVPDAPGPGRDRKGEPAVIPNPGVAPVEGPDDGGPILKPGGEGDFGLA